MFNPYYFKSMKLCKQSALSFIPTTMVRLSFTYMFSNLRSCMILCNFLLFGIDMKQLINYVLQNIGLLRCCSPQGWCIMVSFHVIDPQFISENTNTYFIVNGREMLVHMNIGVHKHYQNIVAAHPATQVIRNFSLYL